MTSQTIPETLRMRRTERHLSQTELAQKLGIRQNQISSLERASVDSRLSTIQNVARILDLELMLVPRQLIPVLDGLMRTGAGTKEEQPLYSLEDANSDTEAR